MFNRTYQLRATKQGRLPASGSRPEARSPKPDFSLRLPWAGIFEPWRPFVLAAEVAKTAVPPRIAAKRCKKASGRLQGVQLNLFPDNPAENFTEPGKFTPGLLPPDFPRPGQLEFPIIDEDRPLADLFPEAYV